MQSWNVRLTFEVQMTCLFLVFLALFSHSNALSYLELNTSILAIETIDDWNTVQQGEARDKELVRHPLVSSLLLAPIAHLCPYPGY